MKKLLLIALLLASNGVCAEVSVSQINNALSKYCIPIPGNKANDDELTCGGVFEAIYTKGESCGCASTGDTKEFKHLVYDPNLRRCKPRCPGGFFIEEPKSNNCSGGQYKLQIFR